MRKYNRRRRKEAIETIVGFDSVSLLLNRDFRRHETMAVKRFGIKVGRYSGILLLTALAGPLHASPDSRAEKSGPEIKPTPNIVNQANAPLSSIMQVRLRDTYIPKFENLKGQGNIFSVDVTMPLPAYRLLPIRHLTRLSMPAVVTTPDGHTGFGDLRFLDLAVVQDKEHFLWGVGPVLVLPTANDRRFGQGKWQVGPSGGFAVSGNRWLLGVLVQNPISCGGDADLPSVNSMVLQPFVSYDFGRGWFIRSQPQLYFDWKKGDRIYPVDIGVGRTFKIGPQVVSCYIQPYWNFSSKGNPPRNGIVAGITFLYPSFWKKITKVRGRN